MVIDNDMPTYLKDLANTAQRCRSHSSFKAPAQEPLCPSRTARNAASRPRR